jgi:hypothetical protein
MQKLDRQTLLGIRDQLGSYAWDDADESLLDLAARIETDYDFELPLPNLD